MTTSSQLKALHLTAQPDSKYFDKETMKFFGDTMSNLKVSKVWAVTRDGFRVQVFELRRERATHKGAPAGVIAYFNLTGSRRHDIDR